MEQRGGCCIARYAGGAYDMSKVDRMMMRFRPIAPKPASPNSTFHVGTAKPEKIEQSVKSTGRGKRRNAATVNKPCGGAGRNRKSSSEDSAPGGETVVKTLSLLPEAPGVKEIISPKVGYSKQSFPQWLSFGGGGGHVSTVMGHVGSWVKVECVIDTWVVDGYGWYGAIGLTDEDRVMGLDVDTCPGFVTDGLNGVRWTNAAYGNMVGGGGEVAVVVERGVVLPVGVAWFTCRVRVVTCGKEKLSKTVPCDVWRMDCGGFAWRLDTTAALSLGLS